MMVCLGNAGVGTSWKGSVSSRASMRLRFQWQNGEDKGTITSDKVVIGVGGLAVSSPGHSWN